jgi:hypothetical protein
MYIFVAASYPFPHCRGMRCRDPSVYIRIIKMLPACGTGGSKGVGIIGSCISAWKK